MKSRIIFPCESSIPFAFELKNVGNIFADFLESLGKVASDKAPKAGQHILGKRKIRYKREGLSYNATYFTEEHVYNDQTQINHHIKLANDGLRAKRPNPPRTYNSLHFFSGTGSSYKPREHGSITETGLPSR